MDAYLEEELQIMNERSEEDEVRISSSIFSEMISELPLAPAYCLDASSTVGQAVAAMQEHNFGSVLLTEEGVLKGILTERDILMKVIGKDNWRDIPVQEVMTSNPVCLRPHDLVVYVFHNMHVGGFRHVPIVDEKGVPLHVVSIKDAVSFLLDHFPEHVLNVTGEPFRGHSLRESA